eukprot:GHVT01042796.1.p1 GENE.GHVT01042796.1~~GHVT01042796.1.p1  ORF type:complete len:102 (-),score=5.35 GHVT01042796.1:737-1042(-)
MRVWMDPVVTLSSAASAGSLACNRSGHVSTRLPMYACTWPVHAIPLLCTGRRAPSPSLLVWVDLEQSKVARDQLSRLIDLFGKSRWHRRWFACRFHVKGVY